MKNQIFVVISVAIVASVLVTGFAPAFAQPTTGTPSPSTAPGGSTTTGEEREKFREFMDCLNAAGLMHPEDVIPTAEDVTSCYDPIYGSGAGDWTSGGASDEPIPGSLLTEEEMAGTTEFLEGLEEGNMTSSDTTGSGMAQGENLSTPLCAFGECYTEGYYDEYGCLITETEHGAPARVCP